MTRGGRLPDPGLAAVCGRCGEPREAHGGPKLYGACPGESGLHARRFSIAPEDRPTNQDQGPELIVRQARAFLPVSAEMLADAQGTGDAVRAFLAMTDEERATYTAKRDAERMAAKAAGHAESRRFLDWLRTAVTVSPFAEAHLEIIDEHQAGDGRDANTYADAVVCSTCAVGEDVEGDPYPCVTLRVLAKAYGWTEGS